MINNFQYFDIDLAINDNREIRGIILENKIKVVLISDKDINRSICTVGVGAGYLQDIFPGTAHFLEHLVFMGSEKYPERNDYISYVQTCGGSYNALTSDNATMYFLELDTSFLKKGIEMLSWFFKKPLLDMKHINSEREIIDSEHNKNLNNDMWIIDDLFKNFLSKNSKFNKFGTGNAESLKNITQKDILDFYEKYYTTCNMYVCIIDTKSVDEMIRDYVHFFNDISSKIYKKDTDRFNIEKINLVENNLIIFKSVSEYNFINIYLVFEIDQKNQLEYQLINFINWLIGTEYKDSISYYLKENNIVNFINTSIDYIYDLEAIINMKFYLNDPSIEKINLVTNYTNNLLNKLNNLKETEFKELYNSFQKIRLLDCLYSDDNKSVDTALEILQNLITTEPHMAILRNSIVPKYTKETFKKFKKILNNVIIKIITNINFLNNKEWDISKWYNTKYIINKYNFKDINNIKNNYNLLNIIPIKNFNIKTDLITKKIKNEIYPKLIYEDKLINRKVYYSEVNKFNKPIANVTVIRYNVNLNDKKNKFLLEIYKYICKSLLNYYIETMFDYKMYFNMMLDNDTIIYNFNGLNYLIDNYIYEILKYIHPDTIFNNPDTEKYFIKSIRDLKEHIINLKYETPYLRVIDTEHTLFKNELLPNEQLELLKNIKFHDFKDKIIECFKYQYEVFMIIGIPNLSLELSSEKDEYMLNENIDYLIKALSLDSNRYFDNSTKKINKNISYKLNYNFKLEDINKKDNNNSILQNFVIYKIPVKYSNNSLTNDSIELIIKHKLICQMVSEILYEPLFDKLRTIDKLGYVVKCDNISKNCGEEVVMLVYYIVQSVYSIKKLKNAISNFNKNIREDIIKNKNDYKEKFNSLKKSKELLFDKPFIDLSEEVSIYMQSFIQKFNIFNINQIMSKIIKKIKYKDFLEGIEKITKPRSKNKSLYIILNSSK